MRSVEDSYWWFTVLRTKVIETLKRHTNPENTIKVLDAGCGTGGMMHSIRLHVPEINSIGIDFSPQAVQLTSNRNVGPVVRASVNELPFGLELFDVIISLDVVLEQEAVNDRIALAELYRVSRKNAYLILNTTAFHCLRGQHDAAVAVKYRHIKKTLAPILHNAGFVIVEISYWNALLFPLLLIWRPLSRLFTGSATPVSDLAPLPEWLNRLMIMLLRLEMLLARFISFPFGSSLFVLAKKG